MEKVINAAIEANTKENPVVRENILIELLTPGCKISAANLAITKAFKDAGIITVSSTSALADCRKYLADSMPDMDTYGDMYAHASDMQDKFEINTDEDKGIASAIKLIKEQLKEDELPIPRKIQLGQVAALKLEYFQDDENEPYNINDLTDFLVNNIDADESVLTEDFKKKMKISAGTDFSYSVGLITGKSVKEMNGM